MAIFLWNDGSRHGLLLLLLKKLFLKDFLINKKISWLFKFKKKKKKIVISSQFGGSHSATWKISDLILLIMKHLFRKLISFFILHYSIYLFIFFPFQLSVFSNWTSANLLIEEKSAAQQLYWINSTYFSTSSDASTRYCRYSAMLKHIEKKKNLKDREREILITQIPIDINLDAILTLEGSHDFQRCPCQDRYVHKLC